jgi:hypothetical protein
MEAPNNGLAPESAPTLRERRELAGAYQRAALARPDPLSANLGMIEGDLMRIAHALGDHVQSQLTQGGLSEEMRRRFHHDMELYLKVLRQCDRLIQIGRQLGSASRGQSQAR